MPKYVFIKMIKSDYRILSKDWRMRDLGMALCVTFDYENGFKTWRDEEVAKLIDYLRPFTYLIGFKLIKFELEILKSYIQIDEKSITESVIDIHQLVKEYSGDEISLNELSNCTLDRFMDNEIFKTKNLLAVDDIEVLIKYLKKQLQLIIELFEFIQVNNALFYFIDDVKTKIYLNLPEDILKPTTSYNDLRAWSEGYFDSMLQGDKVSEKQILFLKKKFDELIIRLEFKTYIQVSERETEIESDSLNILGTEDQNTPFNENNIEDTNDDLPF